MGSDESDRRIGSDESDQTNWIRRIGSDESDSDESDSDEWVQTNGLNNWLQDEWL